MHDLVHPSTGHLIGRRSFIPEAEKRDGDDKSGVGDSLEARGFFFRIKITESEDTEVFDGLRGFGWTCCSSMCFS